MHNSKKKALEQFIPLRSLKEIQHSKKYYLTYTPCPEKEPLLFLPLTLPNADADHFQNSFTNRFSSKFL